MPSKARTSRRPPPRPARTSHRQAKLLAGLLLLWARLHLRPCRRPLRERSAKARSSARSSSSRLRGAGNGPAAGGSPEARGPGRDQALGLGRPVPHLNPPGRGPATD